MLAGADRCDDGEMLGVANPYRQPDSSHGDTAASACCVALTVAPRDTELSGDLASGFKALGDPLLAAATDPVYVVAIERFRTRGRNF